MLVSPHPLPFHPAASTSGHSAANRITSFHGAIDAMTAAHQKLGVCSLVKGEIQLHLPNHQTPAPAVPNVMMSSPRAKQRESYGRQQAE